MKIDFTINYLKSKYIFFQLASNNYCEENSVLKKFKHLEAYGHIT